MTTVPEAERYPTREDRSDLVSALSEQRWRDGATEPHKSEHEDFPIRWVNIQANLIQPKTEQHFRLVMI